ncbi:MAG: ATP-binding cassette domain-containing protein [Muribaculaceae bacterium]|nr:ATP-binding cassette domain-containing protein [Muribaculaceae bacterium]
MHSISINNSLPEIFVGREDNNSQVWLSDITFEKGINYLISAESGTGKSSLCNYIFGTRKDYTGNILFDDLNINNLTIRQWCEIRKKSISYLPQDLRLFNELTALENILLKNKLTGFKTEKEITDYFEILGIPEKINSQVALLSIGQQQRVAIIRTLCQPCDFFLLDEPVSHLDRRNNQIISELLTNEAKKQGAGIISTSVGNHIFINVDKELKL